MLPNNLTDDVFNNLTWKEVDGQELDTIIQDMRIIGSAPVDYPVTDGLILCTQDRSGNTFAFEIGCELFSDNKDENSFYIKMATLEQSFPQRCNNIVVLYSPTQQLFHTEDFSQTIKTNRMLLKQCLTSTYEIVGVVATYEEADQLIHNLTKSGFKNNCASI